MIYCIELNSSKAAWHFTTQNQVTASPIVMKDALYCGSIDGFLFCLDSKTGRLRWKLKAMGPITGAPAASEDRLFIGSTDHSVYAVLV